MKDKIYLPIMIVGIIISIFGSTKIALAEEQEMEVIYEQNSSYSVQIPKSLYLDSNGEAIYSVGVKGTINEDSYIEVVPDSTFLMKDTTSTKEDIQATVTPSKTQWLSNELSQEYNIADGNKITMDHIEVGMWKGTVVYHISLKDGEASNPRDHVHDYTVTITKEPTYTEEGERTYTCECGDTYTETIPKLEDSFDPSDYNFDKIGYCGNDTSYGTDHTGTANVGFLYPNVQWGYESTTKTLYLWGNGEMSSDLYLYMTTYSSSSYTWGAYISKIENVVINNGITSIGNYSFYKATNLKAVTIPSSVLTVGNYAFYSTSLESITIPEGVLSIGASAFSYCSKLVTINLADSIQNLGGQCFANNSVVTSIQLPNNLSALGESIFSNCTALNDVKFPDGLTTVGNAAFAGCSSLTNVNLPDTISLIDFGAFQGSGLDSINIPNSIETIGACAFNNCKSLNTVIINPGTTTINRNAFSNCSQLKNIFIPSSVKNILDKETYTSAAKYSPFYNCPSSTIIYTDAVSSNWSGYWNYYSDKNRLTVNYGISLDDYVNIYK